MAAPELIKALDLFLALTVTMRHRFFNAEVNELLLSVNVASMHSMCTVCGKSYKNVLN